MEREAEALAAKALPATYPREGPRSVAIAFGHRGLALWRGHRHALQGPSLAAANTIMRALAELPITVGWIWLRPDVHLELWQAEYARLRIAQHSGYRNSWAATISGLQSKPDTIATYQQVVDDARALLKREEEAGRPVRNLGRASLLPSIESRVQQLANAGMTSYRDTYELVHRYHSEWVHAGGGSFLRVIESEDAQIFNDERPGDDLAVPRMESVGLLLALIGLVNQIADLGVHDRWQTVMGHYIDHTMAFVERFKEMMATGA